MEHIDNKKRRKIRNTSLTGTLKWNQSNQNKFHKIIEERVRKKVLNRTTSKRKDSEAKLKDLDKRPTKIVKRLKEANNTNSYKGLHTHRTNQNRTHTLSYNINNIGKLGHRGMPIWRGWHSYMRHTQHLKYKVGIKRKRTDL